MKPIDNAFARTVLPILGLLLILFLAACGGAEEAVTPPAGATALPVAPGATTAPAGLAPPLVQTDEAERGDTPPADQEVVPAGPFTAPFPPNVNPLTGETVEDPAVLQRRPIAIKISNAPRVVRPQSGLSAADLVFEHYAEGGVTRLTAVFYDTDASPIGSIRSGRLIDLQIPRMYDAAFASSGSSQGVRQRLLASPIAGRLISPEFGDGGFFRVEDPNKAFEHTLFTGTEELRAVLEAEGLNTPPAFAGSMLFDAAVPEGGTPAAAFTVDYTAADVRWQYNPTHSKWLRWADGEPHLDANTELQLAFSNVVVLAAYHVDAGFPEDPNHNSTEIQLWDEGPASFFRNGQRWDGRWRRSTDAEMVTFFFEDGTPFPLDIGNTFFQVVPVGFEGLVVE
jgi:hypothetical protein